MNPDDSALLLIGTPESNLRFEWNGYDGDDCFRTHRITYTDSGESRDFDFGACSTIVIRKLDQFLNGDKGTVGAGFRIPQIIYYDLYRSGVGLSLHIYSDELDLDLTYEVEMANISFDKRFRK